MAALSFPAAAGREGDMFSRERLCGASAWQGLCAWDEAQAEEGAGTVTHCRCGRCEQEQGVLCDWSG